MSNFKTTDNSMSILGYIFLFLRKKFPDVLEFQDDLLMLPQAIRVESDLLESEINAIAADLSKVDDMVNDDSDNKDENDQNDDGNDEFTKVMKEFYDEAKANVDELQKVFQDTQKEVWDLALAFGETPKGKDSLKFEEFLAVFHDFSESFRAAQTKIETAEAKGKYVYFLFFWLV